MAQQVQKELESRLETTFHIRMSFDEDLSEQKRLSIISSLLNAYDSSWQVESYPSLIGNIGNETSAVASNLAAAKKDNAAIKRWITILGIGYLISGGGLSSLKDKNKFTHLCTTLMDKVEQRHGSKLKPMIRQMIGKQNRQSVKTVADSMRGGGGSQDLDSTTNSVKSNLENVEINPFKGQSLPRSAAKNVKKSQETEMKKPGTHLKVDDEGPKSKNFIPSGKFEIPRTPLKSTSNSETLDIEKSPKSPKVRGQTKINPEPKNFIPRGKNIPRTPYLGSTGSESEGDKSVQEFEIPKVTVQKNVIPTGPNNLPRTPFIHEPALHDKTDDKEINETNVVVAQQEHGKNTKKLNETFDVVDPICHEDNEEIAFNKTYDIVTSPKSKMTISREESGMNEDVQKSIQVTEKAEELEPSKPENSMIKSSKPPETEIEIDGEIGNDKPEAKRSKTTKTQQKLKKTEIPEPTKPQKSYEAPPQEEPETELNGKIENERSETKTSKARKASSRAKVQQKVQSNEVALENEHVEEAKNIKDKEQKEDKNIPNKTKDLEKGQKVSKTSEFIENETSKADAQKANDVTSPPRKINRKTKSKRKAEKETEVSKSSDISSRKVSARRSPRLATQPEIPAESEDAILTAESSTNPPSNGDERSEIDTSSLKSKKTKNEDKLESPSKKGRSKSPSSPTKGKSIEDIANASMDAVLSRALKKEQTSKSSPATSRQRLQRNSNGEKADVKLPQIEHKRTRRTRINKTSKTNEEDVNINITIEELVPPLKMNKQPSEGKRRTRGKISDEIYSTPVVQPVEKVKATRRGGRKPPRVLSIDDEMYQTP